MTPPPGSAYLVSEARRPLAAASRDFNRTHRMRFPRTFASATLALLIPAAIAAAQTDPRVGLKPGWTDAGEAASNMTLVSHRDRPQGFFNPRSMGDFGFVNADFAISGNRLFLGGFNGIQVWDVANPASPSLLATLPCPGGQGDVSVHRNLLFMSVEETRGRVDCGAQGVRDTASAERFLGVRIFDISNVAQPRQVAAVQTCRGSHTHTLVTDPRDPANVYIYVGGTAPVRSPAELAGCSGRGPEDPNTSYFRIEVIRVPVAAPQEARIVNAPRVFADSAGNVAGLWPGGSHGPGTQETATTDQCHDLTAYTEIGLMAGACSGNGILLDIRDPANPKRVAQVSDPNFAYWHNGYIYASEIGRGLDILELKQSDFLSANEIAAAKLVRAEVLNAQNQQRIVWPASFVVARAYLDGLVRRDGLRRAWAAPIYDALTRAERQAGNQRRATLAPVITQLLSDATRTSESRRLRELAEVVRGLTR